MSSVSGFRGLKGDPSPLADTPVDSSPHGSAFGCCLRPPFACELSYNWPRAARCEGKGLAEWTPGITAQILSYINAAHRHINFPD